MLSDLLVRRVLTHRTPRNSLDQYGCTAEILVLRLVVEVGTRTMIWRWME